MKKFYESFTFVMAFLILTLIVDMTFGEKFTRGFLMIVLLSMVVVNSDKFINFIDGKFETPKTTLEKADEAKSGSGGTLA